MDYKHTQHSKGVPVMLSTRNHMGRFINFIVFALITFMTLSCAKFPDAEKDDEGHASFSREAIQVLLGRSAHGVDEVEVVADISELYGRDTAVEMLMKDQQFIDHWTNVMIDLLNVQRQGTGGLSAAQDSSCWTEPTRSTPDPSIAEWVRDHGPDDAGAPTPAWNMVDLIQSSILIDDLSPIYRANLFPMSMRLAGASSRRDAVKDHFLKTYINRNVTCLRCHNPNYSASNKTDAGGDIVWRRLWTITGHPEKALLGDYLDEVSANNRVSKVMRGDIRKSASGGAGSFPWGMSQNCAKDTFDRNARNSGSTTHLGFQTAGASNYPDAGFGSLDGSVNPKVSVWELEDSLRQGVLDLQDGYQRYSPGASADELVCGIVEVFSASCNGCHSGGSPSGGLNLSSNPVANLVNVDVSSGVSTNAKRVVAGSTASSELSRRINAAAQPPRMPAVGGPLSASDKAKIDDWIAAGAPDGDPANCTSSDIPEVQPDEGFAFLTASNLVDGIWMSIMGYRLTIDHGYPRNRKQRDALWNLTEYTFVNNDWSLKSVIRKIMDSNWMGRRAPTISQADSAYVLPMVIDPWVEADPVETPNPSAHEKANGQGELVNRYRVNTVLRKISYALNWKQPRPFPSNGGYSSSYGYPSPLDENLGQYLSPGVPGFSGVNFQSLLALESETGLCNKSGRSLNSEDWIDLLVSQVASFNASNASAPLTVGEVWSILKDRLIQDTSIENSLPSALLNEAGAVTEEQALVAFINQGLGTSLTTNSSASELTAVQLEDKLREGCGIIVKTPDFLLSNITPRGYSDNNMPDPPRLNVCMDGESCGYASSCSQWRSTLNSMGKYTACEDRSVRKSVRFLFPIPNDFIFEFVNRRVIELCPLGICGVIEQVRLKPCLINPEECDRVPPTPMDPTDPDDPVKGRYPGDLHNPGVLSLYADGARVEHASSVLYRTAGMRKWQSLKSGMRLSTGDNLYVPLTASMKLNLADRSIEVDALKYPEIEGVKAHLISVTGGSAINVLDKYFTKRGSLSVSQLSSGLESERYESRGVTDKDWRRIIAYGARPESRYTPSVDEIEAMNKNFDKLHFSEDAGVAPDGTDLPARDNPSDGEPGTPPVDGGSGDDEGGSGGYWQWLVIIITAVALIVLGIGLKTKSSP